MKDFGRSVIFAYLIRKKKKEFTLLAKLARAEEIVFFMVPAVELWSVI